MRAISGKDKKADPMGQSIREEGSSSTKEAKSKMFVVLPDMDPNLESWCAREVENRRGKAVAAARN